MNKWIPILAGVLLLGVVALVVYSQQGEKAEVASEEGKLTVVASFYPLAYLAERIGGEHVAVTNLTPHGVSPHEYRERPSDIQLAERADLFIYHGQEQDPSAEAIAKGLAGKDVVVLKMMSHDFDLLEADDHGHSHDHGHGHSDSDHDDHAAEAIDKIDHLVHEVEDGDMSAEDALEEIDDIIHDLSSDDRNETIRAIDRVVHDFEDGDISAEDAIEKIEDLIKAYKAGHSSHGHGHSDSDHDDHAAEAIDKIDHLVHEVEDGDMRAEDALEAIDDIIHDLSSDDRNETIRAIDRVVHDFEDGDISAADAIEMIEDLIKAFEAGHTAAVTEAIDKIDHLVHEVEDGDMTAEDALEEIEEVIKSLPQAAWTPLIEKIDQVVHEYEDGEIAAADAIEEIEELIHEYEKDDHGHDHAHGEFDPHIWMDMNMMSQMVEIVRDALISLDPDNAASYQENAQELIEELGAMDERYTEELAMCTRRTIVVPHNAFSYLGRRYNIDVLAIAGISPESEPSARRLAELTDLVREENLTHVFFETLASPRIAETLARETGMQALVLNPAEGLTAEQATAGVDFLNLVEQNLDNLKIALDCR